MAAGQRYGRLVAVKFLKVRNPGRHAVWRFRCDCGRSHIATANSVRSRRRPVRSCGCSRTVVVIERDRRYGRLVALRPTSYRHGRGSQERWLFQCDCGRKHVAAAGDVWRGDTRSCGCRKLQRVRRMQKKAAKASITHKMTGTPEHKAWAAMLYRCRTPTSQSYRHYGGRGIKVCKRWLKFENFYADMGNRPSPKHSIDRKNNDGDYTPRNCRWATQSEQMRNTRRAKRR